MASTAKQDRDTRLRWASPSSGHDVRVRWALIALPVIIGALAAVLVIAPALTRDEVSFTLAKDKVEQAQERMRVSNAEYRGEDNKGQAFRLSAGGAVQKSSASPIVALSDLAAEIVLDTGPATITAPEANYNMDSDRIDVTGALSLRTTDGYQLDTANVGVDLKTRTIASDSPVTGSSRLGQFSGQRMRVNLDARTVALEGRARLHIVQGAVKAR